MTDVHMPNLRGARPTDWDRVGQMLAESGLPVEDLGEDRLEGFLVAGDGADIVGLIGLEIDATTGLLRSLVVAKDARRTGLGGKPAAC